MSRPIPAPQVHRARHAEFIYQDNGSDYLVVTFNTLTTRADGKRFFGDSFFNKHRISVLGIVSTAGNWFPRESMEELAREAVPILRQYPHICTYGFSMGAYGAVKYSGLLGAHTTVAFSPQFSINPAHLPAFSAWATYYDEALHQDVAISARDLGGEIFLFHDPHFPHDAHAANSIAALGKNVSIIPVPRVGHTCWTPFLQPNTILDVLQLCREKPPDVLPQLRKRVRDARRSHRLRKQQLALALLKSHPKRALALATRHPDLMEEAFLTVFVPLCQTTGHLDLAVDWARQHQEQDASDPHRIRILVACLSAAGDFVAARGWVESNLCHHPENHRDMITLSQLYRDSAKAAMAADPLNPLSRQTRDQEDAVLWAAKAINMAPGDTVTFRRLSKLLKDFGFPDLGLEILREGYLLHPGNAVLFTLIETEERALRSADPA